MEKIKKNYLLISIVVTMVFAGLYYYVMLPPIHPQSFGFYIFVFLVVGCFLFCLIAFSGHPIQQGKKTTWLIAAAVVVGLAAAVSMILYSPLLRSDLYATRITIDDTRTFEDDVAEVDFDALPLVDKDSTEKLGDRVMGQMAEWVSQFYVSDDYYTQINYQGTILRCTPLEYNGGIKYFTNRKDGIPAYITVNSVTGQSELHKLEQGMKYVDSAWFGENLYRKLRFSYPFDVFGSVAFELDETGHPYWVVPTYSFKGLEMLADINAAIILDPITGQSEKYAIGDIPTWVDHVFTANLVIEQTNHWGAYSGGFWNSKFGQKNVVQTTDGYNYLAMNDDVYLYTGITSVVSDESNLGFILCNLRTKETNFYAIPGAEEYSAMSSAEGQVQQMKYVSSFPLLINLKGKATYVMSLKDNAGLVKMYAFVDVHDYQKVVVTNASEGILKAAENYLGGKIEDDTPRGEVFTKTITVASVTSATVNGNTYYYFTDTEGLKYKVSITVNDLLPFIQTGDTFTVGYETESEVTELVTMAAAE
ncbi:MAG: hypothetical protein HUJ58_04545 [Erysipelotrichaceae bacterium]|nr:hypothetical protein [Erysipelotrichaceae bacterium]